MLEARRAMRMERIFRDRTNPLEIYHDLELIERLRCNETSVFAVAHILSHGSQIGQIEKKLYCCKSTRREKLF
jgi:hypothetical protein